MSATPKILVDELVRITRVSDDFRFVVVSVVAEEKKKMECQTCVI
jgi:hypothetical protein